MENNFTGSSRMRVECVQDLGLGMDLILHPFEKQYLRMLGLTSTPRGNGEQVGAGRTAKIRQKTSRVDNSPILGSSSLISALRTVRQPIPKGFILVLFHLHSRGKQDEKQGKDGGFPYVGWRITDQFHQPLQSRGPC